MEKGNQRPTRAEIKAIVNGTQGPRSSFGEFNAQITAKPEMRIPAPTIDNAQHTAYQAAVGRVTRQFMADRYGI